VALVKALLDACRYCADPANHAEVRKILSDRAYVGTREEYIHLGDPKELTCDLGNPIEYAHHWFYGEGANRPSRTEHLWMMAQMARWGNVPFPRNWLEVLERVVRPATYSIAARELGLLDEKFRRGAIELFDGSAFDAEDPISYLNSLEIKANISIAEVHLDPPRVLAA
jgi:bicarbonate transport system ATP-binding protein